MTDDIAIVGYDANWRSWYDHGWPRRWFELHPTGGQVVGQVMLTFSSLRVEVLK